MYYYGARYYAAWTCRFISVDPLASKYAQLTPYNYADNNPINDYDIDGMQDNNTGKSAQSASTSATKVMAKAGNLYAAVKIEVAQAETKPAIDFTKVPIREPDRMRGPDDPGFWMTQNNYNPEMAHFVATKNAVKKAGPVEGFLIAFGYSVDQASNLAFGLASASGKPQIVSEKIDLTTLKYVPTLKPEPNKPGLLFPPYKTEPIPGYDKNSISINPPNVNNKGTPTKLMGGEIPAFEIKMPNFDPANPISFEGATVANVTKYFEELGWTKSIARKGEGAIRFADPSRKGVQYIIQPEGFAGGDAMHSGAYLKASGIGGSDKVRIMLQR